jgi:hypothetical protein
MGVLVANTPYFIFQVPSQSGTSVTIRVELLPVLRTGNLRRYSLFRVLAFSLKAWEAIVDL